MIYFLAGDNNFLIKKRYLELTDPIVKQFGDLALESLDAEELETSTIIDAIKSPPFLTLKKAVLIRNLYSKDLIELLLESEVPDEVTVIALITKLDKRASYFNKLKKQGNLELFEQKNISNLPNWILNYVKSKGGRMQIGDARYLVERVGQNQVTLSNEIDKLLLYDSRISKENINLLTVAKPQPTTFQLLEAAFSGQRESVQKIYNELRSQKIEPQIIVGLIAWQLHLLALVKLSGNRTSQEIVSQSGVSSYSISKTQKLVNKMTFARIKNLINDASELDYILKTTNNEADSLLLLYLFKLSPN